VLTGLNQPNAAQLNMPAVVVKIDNIDAARPQTAVNQADVVYEELVEGGLTRLAAVFQSQYPTTVGPVRSGRLTDEGIMDDLNHPVFVYSGTNADFLPILRSQPVTDVDDDNWPGQFWRSNAAAAPHNLYTNVASDGGVSTTHQPPSPLFAFLKPGKAFAGAVVPPADHVAINFPAAAVAWSWSPAAGTWLRSQNGTPDVDRAGQQLSATNIIVQTVPYSFGSPGLEAGIVTSVPTGNLVGTGTAWYFSNGHLVQGTWSRSSLESVTSYRTTTGAPIQLTPGRTWIELVPPGVAPTIVS
jgi:hypothetical protein